MESVNNYYDHYKDSWSLQQSYLSERNKLTVTLLVLLVLLAVFMYDSSMIVEKLNIYLNSRVKDLRFGMKYINTGLIFLLLWVLTRYYQTVMKIDRLYDYLNDCEKILSNDKDIYKVNREGEYYKKTRSWMTNVLNYCYGFLLPVAIITIAIIKIVSESGWATRFKIADFIGLGLIIVFSLLYLSSVWFKEEWFDKKKHPKIKWCNSLKKYITRGNLFRDLKKKKWYKCLKKFFTRRKQFSDRKK